MWDQTRVIELLTSIDSRLSVLNGTGTKLFVVLFCFLLVFLFVRFVTPRWLS